MRSGVRSGIVFASLILLLTPALSCFALQQIFSAGANDCCQYMGSQCGSQGMSSSQSCCESPNRSAHAYIGSRSISHFQSDGVAIAATWVFASVQRLAVKAILIVTGFHSPPISPPETASILRI